ncbi:hypothetical protein [Halorubrum ezzemoulense]|nr:hypothetical protein [Halorubrum ezzemoulense]
MANLYEYAPSNSKTGYFLRGRSPTSGYYTLNTTGAANKLFNNLDYTPGRIHHREGDSIPGKLTWRMYQVGLLTTDTDSVLDELTESELRETFEGAADILSLSDTDLGTIQQFINSYTGADKDLVEKLNSLLATPTKPENTDSEDDTTPGFPTPAASEHSHPKKAKRASAAGTSLQELQTHLDDLEESAIVATDAQDLTDFPGGAHTFMDLWNAPITITSILASDEHDVFRYHVETSSTHHDIQKIALDDYTPYVTPDNVTTANSDAFEQQEKATRNPDYIVKFRTEYDTQHIDDDGFDMYIGENPRMIHTIDVEDNHLKNWIIEIKEHDWNADLQLLALDQASTHIDALSTFFDLFDGYTLDSPITDFSRITPVFSVGELTEDDREYIREMKEMSD